MLQYLSAGVPAVVTPVGMNLEVLLLGKVGVAAKKLHDWCDALFFLYENRELGIKYGENGRHIVEKHYSIQVISDRLEKIFTGMV